MSVNTFQNWCPMTENYYKNGPYAKKHYIIHPPKRNTLQKWSMSKNTLQNWSPVQENFT